jgi:hypothetical protein
VGWIWFVLVRGLRFGERAELLEERVHVQSSPALVGLAGVEAGDVDGADAGRLSGWGQSHQLTGVGSGEGRARRDLVPGFDEVINGDVQVGEGGAKRAELRLEGLDAAVALGVVDIVRGEQLIERVEVAVVDGSVQAVDLFSHARHSFGQP